ncbi:MAG: hypothetical protein IH620_02225 [Ignavibacterium sp.]|nr:hypothetical protein [Ignavibacterium sp.]
MSDTIENNEINRLVKMLDSINARLSAIEATINLPKHLDSDLDSQEVLHIQKETSEDLEFRLGEQWFGKIGIIAFLLAVFNFLVLPFASIPYHLILFSGFFISIGLIVSSLMGARLLKNLAGYTMGSGLILLFVSALRLHFFSTDPLLTNKMILIVILFLVTAISLVISIKKESVYLTTWALIFFFSAALISDVPILIFSVLILGGLGVSYLDKKYNWNSLSIFAIILTYLVHLLWYVNNPTIGKEMMIITNWNLNLLVIPIYMIIYGSANANKISDEVDDFYAIQKTTFNSIGGFGLFIFITLNSNYHIAGLLNFGLSLVLLSLASLHWTKQKSKFSTFLYSMLAYAALSVSIVLTFSSPGYFIWLCWQSIAVVSTALWFRSKFIVVANFFIFISIILAYLAIAGETSVSAISFGIVALISARIMNWQKERLELKTEILRIAYLVIAFLILPLVLYINLPSQLVGISYITLAFIYYMLGKLINNKKYRLMASGTLILSIIYIFIFGLTSSDTSYKIFSFLLVSIALVIISIVYAKARAKEKIS